MKHKLWVLFSTSNIFTFKRAPVLFPSFNEIVKCNSLVVTCSAWWWWQRLGIRASQREFSSVGRPIALIELVARATTSQPTSFRSQLLCRLLLWVLWFSASESTGKEESFHCCSFYRLYRQFCEWSVNHCTRYQPQALLNWLEEPLQCTDNALSVRFLS